MNEFKLNCETSGVRLDKFISDANQKSTSFRKVILLL